MEVGLLLKLEALMTIERTPTKRRTQTPRTPPTRKVKKVAAGPIPKAYLELMKQFLLVPIRSDVELTKATAVADELASRRARLTQDEEKYFSVLCSLIEQYEDEAVPMPDIGAADMLRFLIEQRGVTQQTVAVETGIANSTLSAVLTGNRGLTVKHIEKLSAYFGVEPGVFLPGNS
jgi:HTH-type transcriptional regulator / antitoxin HigA